MDKALLRRHIEKFVADSKKDEKKFGNDLMERAGFINYYQSYDKAKILAMTEVEVYEYISRLWAMLIWGNKHYVVDKIIQDNGLAEFKNSLAYLVWASEDLDVRWDSFRHKVKGMGPAMISEILCKAHPAECMLWNRRAYVGLDYLGAKDLPRYDYQLTGKRYKYLCEVSKEIAEELKNAGFKDTSLLAVDYFIWDQLQFENNLSKIHEKKPKKDILIPVDTSEEAKFIHDDIRDKLRDIGQWLGFSAKTEQPVAPGSKVDAIWESTIGNMGRIVYIFEVQTRGSIDSLMLNLLKSLKNPAVQGIVAVSDHDQLDKIRNEAQDIKELKDKLRYWDYLEVIEVHESLEFTNDSINRLGLVPQGF